MQILIRYQFHVDPRRHETDSSNITSAANCHPGRSRFCPMTRLWKLCRLSLPAAQGLSECNSKRLCCCISWACPHNRVLGCSEGSSSEAKFPSFLEQEAHELLDSRDFLSVGPERHDVLELVELTHTPSLSSADIAPSLKGVIQGSDRSKLVTPNIL